MQLRVFVELAGLLQQLAQTASAENVEPLLRTAISRAYYGAFGHARQFAQAKRGFKPRGEAEDHRELVRVFTGKFSQVANRLTDLRHLRNKADYEENPPVEWEVATEVALQDAKKIVGALKLT
jgi:uncharacterized protein (UPF0332 family)